MFHTCNFQSAGFQDWLHATNQLHLSHYLELGGRKKDFLPLLIDAHPQDQFLLYIDDEVGICGSAALTALPYALEISDQIIPQGTWMLRNVFFYLQAGHPFQEQPDKFNGLVERFHLGLFQHLWEVAQRSHHKVALSLQNDLEAHEDLAFFGGFTFNHELIKDEKDIRVAMDVISLTDQTYKTYQQKTQASASHQR